MGRDEGPVVMRKLIYIIIIGVAGYLAYANFGGEIAKVLPASMFTTEVPQEFRGRYISDLRTNADFLRNKSGFKPAIINQLLADTGKERIEIKSTSIISSTPGGVEDIELKVLETGPGYMRVLSHNKTLDRDLIHSVTLDGDGIWVASDDIIPGLRERYRRIDR